MNWKELARIVERDGARGPAVKVAEFYERGKAPVESYSLRACWEAFIGPVEDTLPRVMAGGGLPSRAVEEVRSGAFAHVTQAVLIKMLDAGYQSQPSILDNLVTVVNDTTRTLPMVAFSAIGSLGEVPEGQEYPGVGFTDRAVIGPEPPKRGAAIEITDEAIRMDQTGRILNQARDIGRKLAMDREKHGLYAIQDITGYKAFYPVVAGAPTQTDLYRSSAAGSEWYNKSVNLKTSNALVNYTDLEAAWLLLQAMTDEVGDYIDIQPNVLLVPTALLATAAHVLNAVQVETGADSDSQRTASANAVVQAMGLSNLKLLSSYYLDAQSASTWYLGDFKAQFYEHVIIPREVKQADGDPRRDIVTQFIARRKARVYARDDKFVIKNTA